MHTKKEAPIIMGGGGIKFHEIIESDTFSEICRRHSTKFRGIGFEDREIPINVHYNRCEKQVNNEF